MVFNDRIPYSFQSVQNITNDKVSHIRQNEDKSNSHEVRIDIVEQKIRDTILMKSSILVDDLHQRDL